MTKHLSDTLGLPLLEDALREQGRHPGNTVSEDDEDDDAGDFRATMGEKLDAAARAAKRLAEVGGEDHSRTMDSLNEEVMRHARDLMDLGFNMEHGRARGIFEQAANFYKIGLDAKNSKRDAQLKAMRLALDQRRVEIDERKSATEIGEPTSTVSGTLMTGDRNELLRMLREKTRA